MPHDCKGKPLKRGDRVKLTLEIVSLGSVEKDCNAIMKVIDLHDTGETYLPSGVVCNSRLLEKVD